MRRACLATVLTLLSAACSTSSSGGDGGPSAGGAGGASSAGSSAGGASSAGSSAGGASSAGSSAGGASSAGSSAGGASSAGASAGGASSAGASAGGASSAGAAGAPSSFVEAPDGPLHGIVAAHNQARASVSPPAPSPLPELSWDEGVAAAAAAWADGCEFAHDPKLGALKQGQNIYASSGSTPTPEKVVGSWVSEVASYDYATNKCAQGKQCGHYTQVVWAKSTGLGCAQKTCTTNSPFGGGKWDLWVCNYSPPGNYSGQKPY
ncbi:MAG: serine protease [Polyangiaceae bacterium]|nr:serine protease [Polyangiaceae bacterium]